MLCIYGSVPVVLPHNPHQVSENCFHDLQVVLVPILSLKEDQMGEVNKETDPHHPVSLAQALHGFEMKTHLQSVWFLLGQGNDFHKVQSKQSNY